MSLVAKAAFIATARHSGQKRKYGNRPYIYHPEKVVKYLLEKQYKDENLLAAAWCHDLIEDTGTTYEQLVSMFNVDIANLVYEVSHPNTDPKLNRVERWEIYLEHYEKASKQGRILKLADRDCNLREYIDFWPQIDAKGKNFLDHVYLNETADLIDSIGSADPRIRDDIIRCVDEIDELLVDNK